MEKKLLEEQNALCQRLSCAGFEICKALDAEAKWHHRVAYATAIFSSKPLFTGYHESAMGPVAISAEAQAEWQITFDEDLLSTDEELVKKYTKEKPDLLYISLNKTAFFKYRRHKFETKTLIHIL